MTDQDDVLARALDVGEHMLIDKGFEAFSLEEVAAVLGVEPSILLNQVGAKEELTALIVRNSTRRTKERIFEIERQEGESSPGLLHRYARRYLDVIFKREQVRIYRIAASAANAQPHISVQFRAAARSGNAVMADILRDEIGVMLPEGYSYDDAAGQFFALCRGAMHHQMLFDIDYRVSPQELDNAASKAAATFLRAYPLASKA